MSNVLDSRFQLLKPDLDFLLECLLGSFRDFRAWDTQKSYFLLLLWSLNMIYLILMALILVMFFYNREISVCEEAA